MGARAQSERPDGPGPPGPFGSFLVDSGVLKPAELDEARRSQAVYGGRLGTNLVELGYLGLEELATHLAAYHGVAIPPIAWLEAPDPRAQKLVPMALVRKLKLLPLHLDRDAIHVAMVDPCDPDQLDFVATAASRPVVAYVLPEIRLLYWLEVHLQIDRHPRYVNLAARLRRTDLRVPADVPGGGPAVELPADAIVPDGRTSDDPPAAAAPELLEQWFNESALEGLSDGEPEPARREPAQGQAHGEEPEEELLLEDLFEEGDEPAVGSPSTPAPAAPVEETPLLSAAQVAELEATMDGVTRTDDVIDLVLRLARTHCEAAVLFLVRGDRVRPYRRAGAGSDGSLDGIEMPLHVHSIFSHPAVTGFAFRGSPPEGGIDARLLDALARGDIQELLVQPISIDGRVVNLLYCDNGGSAFGETSIAALGALADRAAVAYERLILERKRAASAG